MALKGRAAKLKGASLGQLCITLHGDAALTALFDDGLPKVAQ
jgi:hypothetical protein